CTTFQSWQTVVIENATTAARRHAPQSTSSNAYKSRRESSSGLEHPADIRVLEAVAARKLLIPDALRALDGSGILCPPLRLLWRQALAQFVNPGVHGCGARVRRLICLPGGVEARPLAGGALCLHALPRRLSLRAKRG